MTPEREAEEARPTAAALSRIRSLQYTFNGTFSSSAPPQSYLPSLSSCRHELAGEQTDDGDMTTLESKNFSAGRSSSSPPALRGAMGTHALPLSPRHTPPATTRIGTSDRSNLVASRGKNLATLELESRGVQQQRLLLTSRRPLWSARPPSPRLKTPAGCPFALPSTNHARMRRLLELVVRQRHTGLRSPRRPRGRGHSQRRLPSCTTTSL